MALPPPASLFDPLGGYADLCARRLVPASASAFADDPARLLRAARLAAALAFAPTEETQRLAREAAPHLHTIAPERVGEEITLLFTLPRADQGWALLRDAEAIMPLLPGLQTVAGLPPERAMEHLLAALAAVAPLHAEAERGMPDPARFASVPSLRAWYADQLERGERRIALLRWGVLAHALAPHDASTLAHGLQGAATADRHRNARPTPAFTPGGRPRATARAVSHLWPWARWLLLADVADAAEWRRFFSRTSLGADQGVHTVVAAVACQAALAAHGAAEQRERLDGMAARARMMLASFLTERERWVIPALLTGADLTREMGLPPGRLIGQILMRVHDAQIAGQIATREEAFVLARALARCGRA